METIYQRIGVFFNKSVVRICLIIAVGFIAYANTFHVPFHFDDQPFIVENPIIRNFKYFLEPSAAKGFGIYDTFKNRYVGYLSFAMNYRLNGLNVPGYHVVNLAVHLANGLLIYWLASLTFRTPYFKSKVNDEARPIAACRNLIPLFSALLFVSHPIQTQAVTYIYQRVTSLVALFYLLSLVLYIKARLGQCTGKLLAQSCTPYYLLSLISALLAMKTKENAFTLPMVITLYEYMFLEGRWRKRIVYLLPFLLTLLVIPLSLIGIDKPVGDLIGDVSQAARMQTEMSRWHYLLTQFRVIVTYIRLIFLPINQNLDYDYPIYNSFTDPNVFLSFTFLSTIFVVGVYLFYRSKRVDHETRLIAFGIFWFFISLSIESSVLPIVDVIFEHRMYLPSVGLFVSAVTIMLIVANRLRNTRQLAVKFMLAYLIAVSSALTYARNTVWEDEITLWSDTASKSPKKSRAINNLGHAYFERGQVDEAIKLYELALHFDPNNAEAHCNIGNVYESKGLTDRAITHYLKALELKPVFAEARFNLAGAYASQGRFDSAVKYFQSALKMKPDDAEAHNDLGTVYYNQERFNEAIYEYTRAISLKQDSEDVFRVYYNLAVAYERVDMLDDAIKAYETVQGLNPDYAVVYNDLGVAYEKKGWIDKAINQYRAALQLNSNDQLAKRNLERIIGRRQ